MSEELRDEFDTAGEDDAGPPPLVVSGPDGRRVVVVLKTRAHTVGELADSLGLSRRVGVVIDGRSTERRVRLDRTDIGHGSRVTGPADRTPCRATRGRSSMRTSAGGTATESPPRVGVTVEAGPAAGHVVELVAGRHVIGRTSSAAVRLDDDLVELHHAIVDVGELAPDVTRFTQLAGRVPCRAAGAGAAGDAQASEAIDGKASLSPGSVVAIGASRIRLGAAPSPRAAPAALARRSGDPWRYTLHRSPRQIPAWEPEPIVPPAADLSGAARAAGGLLAAALSVAGGVAMAMMLHNPMFLMFSCLGFFVAVGTRLGGTWSARKQRRQRSAESKRDRERFARDVAAQRAAKLIHHVVTAPTVTRALTTALDLTESLWARRAGHPDAFAVTLGWGTVAWAVALGDQGFSERALSPEAESIVDKAGVLHDVPVTTALGPGRSVAVVGKDAAAVARSLVVQMAAFTGPADWRLIVVADEVDAWDWCAWLPHASSGTGSDFGPLVVGADTERLAAMLARLDDGDERHTVVVTDRPDLLASRTGPLRRYVGAAVSVSILAVVRPGAVVPSMCHSVLEIGSLCAGRWTPDTSSTTAASTLHAAGLSTCDADDAARRLARVHDPEDPSESAGALPTAVSLSRLQRRCGHGAVDDAISIAAMWRSGRRHGGDSARVDGHPRATIGVTADGLVEIDLVRDGPHALIAGTTGAGKSELLRTLVASLAAGSSPDDITFVLIDYKGGSTFDVCADLPHTVGVVTDLDDRLAERALISLEAEIRRRERLLREAAVDDLDAYRAQTPLLATGRPLPRLVVIIDEFAALAADLPGFLPSLVGVAQRGRSLGIHLLLATQRPAGVVSDDIRANTNLRIALRLQDRADAVDIVGGPEPVSFPRGTPGRAMMRLGPGETLVFQTAHSSGIHRPLASGGLSVTRQDASQRSGESDAGAVGASVVDGPGATVQLSELEVLARSIRGAASLCEIEPPFRPWLEPLPGVLGPDDLTDRGPGAVGLVDDPSAQSQDVLCWEPSEGNLALIGSLGSGTTTALRSLLVVTASEAHVYVVDARGDGDLDELAALPGCGDVVGLHDAERRTRLVGVLAGELERRQASLAAARQPIILAIDGLAGLMAGLGGPADLDEHTRLARVLADGAGVGIHAVATLERPGAVPLSVLSAFGQRWLFHVDDPLDAATLGVKAAAVPPAIPGRVVVVGSKLEAQVAVLQVPRQRRRGQVSPPPIGTLADDIDAATMPRGSERDTATILPVGIDFARLEPATLDLPDGEHVLIAGPARSGRSTALIRTVAAWRGAHPDGVVVVYGARRTSPVLAWVADQAPDAVVAADEAAVITAVGAAGDDRRVLVAVDDAERVDDIDGALFDLVSERRPNIALVAAGRPDALRTMYGHWTAVVRRSRLGLIMTAGGDGDGDLFGEPLPRRPPLAARTGLAWVFGGGRRLVQVARDHPRVSCGDVQQETLR